MKKRTSCMTEAMSIGANGCCEKYRCDQEFWIYPQQNKGRNKMSTAKKRININMLTKNFWLIIGALAVLSACVVGGNAYKGFEEKNLEETNSSASKEIRPSIEEIDPSNWKTYKNEEYKFEVKYPNYWDSSSGPLPNCFYFGSGGPYEYQVGIKIVPADSKFDEIYKEKVKEGWRCHKFLLSSKEAWRCTIIGTIEEERGIKNPYEIETTYVGVEYKEMFYNFSVSAKRSKASKKFNIFNQMLSSFRFIE